MAETKLVATFAGSQIIFTFVAEEGESKKLHTILNLLAVPHGVSLEILEEHLYTPQVAHGTSHGEH